MLAVDDVHEEPLSTLKLRSLLPDAVQLALDHASPVWFTPVQHLPDLRQAHAGALACLQDPQAVEMLLAVVAMAGRRAVRDDDAFVVPVPQHMGRHAKTVSGFPDLHETIIAA